MNIFYLDRDPVVAAKYQCDKHVVKMILETAQLLSTAHRCFGNEDEMLYKITHKNHPSAIWVRESSSNYKWLYEHFVALCDEYTYRYDKIHKTDTKLRDILYKIPNGLKDVGMTEIKLAMNNNPECIIVGDPVSSYRNYYKTKKDKFVMNWTKSPVPDWFGS